MMPIRPGSMRGSARSRARAAKASPSIWAADTRVWSATVRRTPRPVKLSTIRAAMPASFSAWA